MKVLFACGGTGGHINPAIAVAKVLRERHPEAEIWFAGAERGMEVRLIPAEGFVLKTVDVEGFNRKISVASIQQNTRAVRKVYASLKWAKQILSEFSPDVVVGTGGYASFPVLYAAAKHKIPTVIHESNAYPGLTTRILSRYVDRVLVNFEVSADYLKSKNNVRVSGMPIREDMIYQDKMKAKRELGLDDRPLIVSFWGSLGAREMNKYMAEFIQFETKKDHFRHIHATGKFGYAWMPELIHSLGVDLKEHPNIDLREYIHDMPRVMTAADLIMCRGGASTLSELAALAKPAIIVPSPNVSDNHQEKNARVLEQTGGAVVISECDCNAELLYNTATKLLSDRKQLALMSKNLEKIAVLDGCERIYEEIITLYRHSIR